MAKVPRINRSRPVVKRAEIKIRKKIREAFLTAHLSLISAIFQANKAVQMPSEWKPDWGYLESELLPVFEEVFLSGAVEAAAQVESVGVRIAFNFDNDMREKARQWAVNQSAQLVTKVSSTTKTRIASEIADGLEQGLTVDEIARGLSETFQFSDERAEMIARTETAFADVSGNMASYRANGVEKKQWITAGDSEVSDECMADAAQGPIPIMDPFQDGTDAPPGHPNCRCDVIPVIELEDK